MIEQSVLLSAASAYMDALRDTANLEVQRSSVRVLQKMLKDTRSRRAAGEIPQTDVAQAEAQLAAGEACRLPLLMLHLWRPARTIFASLAAIPIS